MSLTAGKIKGLEAVSNQRGIIAALAMDQRGSLEQALKGAGMQSVSDEEMQQFKVSVAEILSPYASAMLLDTEYGLPAAAKRDKSAGLLLAYEKSGYDNTRPGRMPDLLEHLSARRIGEKGADAVKLLLYFTPEEKDEINDEKFAFIERVGDECRGADIPFFLEPVSYDPGGGDVKGIEFARKKPQLVIESMKEFSKDRYGVDILKVEIPVNMKFVEGQSDQTAYSHQEAIEYFQQAAQAAGKPFIYLTAGVSNKTFTDSLEMATEAGVKFAGVLAGRATWLDGVKVYAADGNDAFRRWLETQGVENIQAINERLRGAQPWYAFYGASSPQDVLNSSGTPSARQAVTAG
jgi:tagatose 1,6-diphosphate aldolase